jgi:hypothetical protein
VNNNSTKKLHFLSGLPRSGSTVLAAILNQNPQTHVSTTSGLGAALDALATTWHREPLLEKNDRDRKKLANAMRGLIHGYYDEITSKPIVIDKARNWPLPVVVSSMAQVLGHKPRIIATVRSVPDCMASFVRVAKPENLDDFIQQSGLTAHLKSSYQVLQAGYQADPECFLFVEYEDLLANPRAQLQRIHDFLGLDPFDYDFERIDGSTVKEDDEVLHGVAGLHDIKPKLGRQHNQSPHDVLGHHYGEFCQPEFWMEKPRTTPIIDDLDLQLTASTMGNFAEGRRIADKLKSERPNDHKAAFNRGWYELNVGKIEDGYALLHRGRRVGVFGNSAPKTPQPEWDGKTKGTVLLYLEGGLGDQIHQVRYAADLSRRGCGVIVSCSGSLVSLLQKQPDVAAVVQHGAEYGVYHDCWLPAMSAPLYLGLGLTDLSGAPYISRPVQPEAGKIRIGLRWSGNKQFEAQHHKLFPAEPFFDAVKRADVEFISLQRDADLEFKPHWVAPVALETWNDTQKAVASCDLVISSCTSVSHLSAAIGVPTWVVIPIMGYYLYAMPGPRTPYYDSMRLFRQVQFGQWSHCMEELKEAVATFNK